VPLTAPHHTHWLSLGYNRPRYGPYPVCADEPQPVTTKTDESDGSRLSLRLSTHGGFRDASIALSLIPVSVSDYRHGLPAV
jgi:hypothetical protein